ncbi:3-phosphoserine/phosphohydroxythreonine transaminase [Gynuella sunshinyii]|uniref:Phosphoserine aminotransferase n=1 Tax=Gynuella sunshinyii YC6258 TaxID=1445510 RepID=A0A0C5VAS8_9GAMM|nr:3-phosphoserine/phosphohydroxythreonine transaminase [Gynuella sunshinyii]AJQ96450.1 phosphoserine aminotransferase [Gynuella sunshinyii YC6258]
MTRSFNFCAGPAALPTEVLEQAQQEMLDYQGSGMSIMEMSHRGKMVVDISETAKQDLKDLLSVSDDYEIIYMQGGATAQFSMIPLNLLGKNNKADFVNTGIWSQKAIQEASRYADVSIAATTESSGFTRAPEQGEINVRDDAVYLHYTPNETIGGVEFSYIPESPVPLVADMSSNILSRPLDVSRYGLIYAGAQKNIGPSGLVWVIVRKDLLDQAMETTPSIMSYALTAKNASMLNTPPSFSVYMCGLVFKWLKTQGGVAAMGEINERKAARLYNFIDQSEFFANPVAKDSRSLMNVPFTLRNSDLDKQFLAEAEAVGLRNLAGHRSVGGMRASIYNAVPERAVDALIQFMADFEKQHG